MLIKESEIRDICRRIINEVLSEEGTDFGINVKGNLTKDDIKAGVPLYHRPKDSRSSDPLAVINSLMKYGFSREYTGSNGGNMYGPGVYNVYELRSSNEKARGYGRFIVKSYLLGGFKNFLIFNEDIAREVYGKNYWIGDQIKLLFPKKIADDVLTAFRGRLYMNSDSNLGRNTSSIAVSITDFLGRDIAKSKVRGIIYSGGHDGACAFVRNFSDVIPFAYSADNGKTWTEGITDELIWRAGHNTDVEANLRGTRDDKGEQAFSDTADRAINGFVIVYKNNKANYFEVAQNKLISDVWFDYAGNFDEEGIANVQYKGKEYRIQKYEDNFIVMDPDEGPLCYLADLPSREGEGAVAMAESVNEEKTVITEEQKKIDNFDFVLNNIAKFENDDIAFPVQIIRRWKDNCWDFRGREIAKRQGNYNGGAWYLKHWIVKSADELKALKPEIIKMCEENNARAYITINPRSFKATSDFIASEKQKYGSRYNPKYEIISWLQPKSGYNWKNERPRILLDIDSKNKYIWNAVKKMIEDYGIKTDGEYTTPSGGLHIILSDKNQPEMRKFREALTIFDAGQNKGRLATAHPNEDAKMILYSNVNTKGY